MGRPPNTETRCKILSAAVSLFHKCGYRGVSMDDVAESVGIKKANLFHYFPAKEELGLAALCEGFECRQAQISQCFEGHKDPIKAVAGLFDEAIETMRRSHCSKGCFIGNFAQEISDHSERLRQKLSECFNCWTESTASLIESAKGEGYFRKELNPRQIAGAIVALFEGAILVSKAQKDTGPLVHAKKFAIDYLNTMRA